MTILDRSWILEKVYGNDRVALAVEALGLVGTLERPTDGLGPNDAARLRQLEELDAQITDPSRYQNARYSLAEDCLTSALLARGLERPRTEVEARFTQARRVADELGLREQRTRVLYLQAWTALWWYEDYGTLVENYSQIEPLVQGSPQAEQVEKLSILWQLLAGACVGKKLDADSVELSKKRATVLHELERLASDSSRPNNSLQAKFNLSVMAAHQAIMARDRQALDSTWRAMLPLVTECDGLLGFPVERTISLIEDLGEFVPRTDDYEALLDAFLPVLERRRSSAGAGLALLQRGMQKLEAEHYEDAIRLLGRAELRLAKHEHIEPFIQVLSGLSHAYLAIGLPWAARTKLLLAVDRGFALMHAEGDISPVLLRALFDFMWVEIRLGRVPQAIAAWRYLATIGEQMEMEDSDRADLYDDYTTLGLGLGYLLAKSSSDELQLLTQLPDTLGALGLETPRMLLLWALGHEDRVREEYLPANEQHNDIAALFKKGTEQPLIQSLPDTVIVGADVSLQLTCSVLGCEFRFELPNELSSIAVAESVMSALEAFFATSLAHRIAPFREYLRFKVVPTGPETTFATVWHEEAPELWIEIQHPTPAQFLNDADRQQFSDWLRDLIGETLARSFFIDDARGWLEAIAGEEEGLSRAITLGNVPILESSVFGDEPLHRLSYWIDENAEAYPMLRDQPWHEWHRERLEVSSGDGEFANVTHAQRQVTSIINLPLWDEAGWSGTGVALFDASQPPILAFSFRNMDAGSKIFEEWRARVGEVDTDELIRIAVIRGLSRANPSHYAVTVGRSVGSIERQHPHKMLLMLSRINRMEVQSSQNLDMFLDVYDRQGRFALVPMKMRGQPQVTDFRFDLAIMKRELAVRAAWEIGPHDTDLSALRYDDDPIIPEGVTNAPVIEALDRVREMRSALPRTSNSGKR